MGHFKKSETEKQAGDGNKSPGRAEAEPYVLCELLEISDEDWSRRVSAILKRTSKILQTFYRSL